MKQYLDLLQDVKDNGRFRADRTGVGAYGVFGRQLRCDLSQGFPLLTTKKLFTRGIIAELLWFLAGDTKETTLRDQKVGIWKEWAPKGPELHVYDRLQWLNESSREAYMAAVRTENTQRIEGESDEDFRNRDIAADIAHYTPILDAAGAPTHAECDGDLGRIYGAQWRKWRYAKDYGPDQGGMRDHNWAIAELDQISNLIRDLKTNPNSRRHIVTAWNPGELDQMALPPCHCLFQFHTEALTEEERKQLWEAKMGRKFLSEYIPELYANREDWDVAFDSNMAADYIPKYRLSCQLYQRSADLFLGVPFNIASYSLLTMMVAQCVNMVPGDFVHTYGDLHIYANHFDQVNEQLAREPRWLPTMNINPEVQDIFSFKVEDFTLRDYSPHAAIKAEVAV